MSQPPGQSLRVFRVHAADARARARLCKWLSEGPGVMVVEFRHDRLPDLPWPELADPRVRVAFAPARRAVWPAPVPISSTKEFNS